VKYYNRISHRCSPLLSPLFSKKRGGCEHTVFLEIPLSTARTSPDIQLIILAPPPPFLLSLVIHGPEKSFFQSLTQAPLGYAPQFTAYPFSPLFSSSIGHDLCSISPPLFVRFPWIIFGAALPWHSELQGVPFGRSFTLSLSSPFLLQSDLLPDSLLPTTGEIVHSSGLTFLSNRKRAFVMLSGPGKVFICNCNLLAIAPHGLRPLKDLPTPPCARGL